jgi:hypothetical protein
MCVLEDVDVLEDVGVDMFVYLCADEVYCGAYDWIDNLHTRTHTYSHIHSLTHSFTYVHTHTYSLTHPHRHMNTTFTREHLNSIGAANVSYFTNTTTRMALLDGFMTDAECDEFIVQQKVCVCVCV